MANSGRRLGPALIHERSTQHADETAMQTYAPLGKQPTVVINRRPMKGC